MSVLSQPQFHDEEAAFAFLEEALWPAGPVCPHCGCMGRIAKIKANPEKRVRYGLNVCRDCSKQFTVKVGTVFEHARIPLHKMLQAVHLMCSSKTGISAHQLHRTLEVTYKTAWFLEHRIREAMRSGVLAPMGGAGGKHKVLSLVDRETGQKRSMVVDNLSAKTLTPILEANIAKEARVMTDEAGQYGKLSGTFAQHDFVRHGTGEYVNLEDRTIHRNTIEGAFSIFKRGMKGIYQHCGKQHLHRYLAEFDFRYNQRVALGVNDPQRTQAALAGIRGKRLTYRLARPNA